VEVQELIAMQDKKHICHCTSVHKSSDVRILLKECRSLVNAGFRVSLVVAGAEDEIKHGVSIFGVPKNSGRAGRFLQTVNAVVARAASLGADADHLHDPELFRGVTTLRKTGAKVVYDAHEDLPKQVLSKPYIPILFRGVVAALAGILERSMSRRLSGVVCATPIIANRFSMYIPNTVAVCNFPSLEDMPQPVSWDQKSDEVCYIGGIFKTRGAMEMVRAMDELSLVRLNLAGTFSPISLRQEVSAISGWQQVNELGFLDRTGIRSVLSRSKVGLVLLHPTQSYTEALPVKLFEYMAAGLPVVASDFPILKDIVERHQCGFCVDPLDTEAITSAIRYLMEHPDEAAAMGLRGRLAVENQYSWQSQEEVLIQFYQNLLS